MKLAPRHLKRYKDVASLFFKYGSKDLVDSAGFPPSEDETEAADSANGLAKDLEALGPAFIKIGQLLSTRADLLPPSYLEALSRLQDDVEPFPWEEAEKILRDELGARPSRAFDHFDETPISTASLGQVHRARLRSGREVAVKIQRPGIRKEILSDIESLEEIAEWLDSHTAFGEKYEICRIVSQFRKAMLRELDYRMEAGQLKELKRNLSGFPALAVPSPIDDYTTSRVLTMDFIEGVKITSVSKVVMQEIDGEALADEFLKAYLKQVLVDGFFHADPHPGNVLLTRDHRLGIIDLGMVGRVHERVRDQLVHLLAGIGNGDGLQTAEAALGMAVVREGHEPDRAEFTRRVEDIVGASGEGELESMQMGSVVMQVSEACADCGLRVPTEISLLGKTLLNLDQIGFALSPGFNPTASIRRHLTGISEERASASLRPANLVGMLTEAKHLFEMLPSRLNRLAEMLLDNKLKFTVDAIDEDVLMQGLQKIANRITVGLVLAALIVGSSLLMQVETDFRILGYPGLAIVFFLVAAIGGITLLFQILFRDR